MKEDLKKLEKWMLIIVAIVAIVGIAVTHHYGYERGFDAGVASKECPYFYHSYDIEKTANGEKIFVYETFNSTRFDFWHRGDSFSIGFYDSAHLDKSFDVHVNLERNRSTVEIWDDKYVRGAKWNCSLTKED